MNFARRFRDTSRIRRDGSEKKESKLRKILRIVGSWVGLVTILFGALAFAFGKGQLQTIGVLILLGVIAWGFYKIVLVPFWEDIRKVIDIIQEK